MHFHQSFWHSTGILSADSQPVATQETDFRIYVFVAYGAVILLLLLFSIWSVAQTRAAERKLDQLKERLDHSEK